MRRLHGARHRPFELFRRDLRARSRRQRSARATTRLSVTSVPQAAINIASIIRSLAGVARIAWWRIAPRLAEWLTLSYSQSSITRDAEHDGAVESLHACAHRYHDISPHPARRMTLKIGSH